MSLLFIFLDGVGLAPAGPDNPLTDAPMPALQALLGGPLTLEQAAMPGIAGGRWEGDGSRNPHSSTLHARPSVLLRAIDATLGVPGLPQSGTGQTALLAGMNAAALHGRHQPHVPPVALRPLLAERSIFRRVHAAGRTAAFANAFGPGYWEALAARRIRRSASVIAAEGAGLRFRDLDDLRRGAAVAWDITGVWMRGRPADWPPVPPARAGEHLAALGRTYDLVFFECFLPDLAGHGRLDRAATEHGNPRAGGSGNGGDRERASLAPGHPPSGGPVHAAMGLIDGLIGGALAAMRPEDTLLLTSDHGNIESRAAAGHTRNPAPLLAVGPAARAFAGVESIADVADAVLVALADGGR